MRARGDYEAGPPGRSVAFVRPFGTVFNQLPRKEIVRAIGVCIELQWPKTKGRRIHSRVASIHLTDLSRDSPANDRV